MTLLQNQLRLTDTVPDRTWDRGIRPEMVHVSDSCPFPLHMAFIHSPRFRISFDINPSACPFISPLFGPCAHLCSRLSTSVIMSNFYYFHPAASHRGYAAETLQTAVRLFVSLICRNNCSIVLSALKLLPPYFTCLSSFYHH